MPRQKQPASPAVADNCPMCSAQGQQVQLVPLRGSALSPLFSYRSCPECNLLVKSPRIAKLRHRMRHGDGDDVGDYCARPEYSGRF